MKIYYLFGRLLRPFFTVGFYCYCVVTKTPRVRVVVRNEHNDILLVQSWLSKDEWSFPGGGVGRGESFAAAACRELREETGIKVEESSLEQCDTIRTWAHDEILFSVRTKSAQLPQVLSSRYEIKKAAWFSASATPKLGALATEILARVATHS